MHAAQSFINTERFFGTYTHIKDVLDLVCSSQKTLLHLCNKNRMDLADFRELTYVLVEEGSVGQGSTSLIFTALSYTRETIFCASIANKVLSVLPLSLLAI